MSEQDGQSETFPEDQSEGDFMYVDDDLIADMDRDDQGLESESDGSDFKTMKESDMDQEEAANFHDGDVLDLPMNLENDAVCQLSLVHQDHVYCVA